MHPVVCIGKRVKTVLLDITNEAQRVAAVDAMRAAAKEWNVQPYALINNAGIERGYVRSGFMCSFWVIFF